MIFFLKLIDIKETFSISVMLFFPKLFQPEKNLRKELDVVFFVILYSLFLNYFSLIDLQFEKILE